MKLQVTLAWDGKKSPEARRPFHKVERVKGGIRRRYNSIFDVQIQISDPPPDFGDLLISGLIKGRKFMETYMAKLDKAAGNRERIRIIPYESGVREVTSLPYHEVPGKRVYAPLGVDDETVGRVMAEISAEDKEEATPRQPLLYLLKAIVRQHDICGELVNHFDYLSFWRDEWRVAADSPPKNVLPYGDYPQGDIFKLIAQMRKDIETGMEFVQLDWHGLPTQRIQERHFHLYPGLRELITGEMMQDIERRFQEMKDEEKRGQILGEARSVFSLYRKSHPDISRLLL